MTDINIMVMNGNSRKTREKMDVTSYGSTEASAWTSLKNHLIYSVTQIRFETWTSHTMTV
jgi:hypothetical protein